jgi:hypothetical protein
VITVTRSVEARELLAQIQQPPPISCGHGDEARQREDGAALSEAKGEWRRVPFGRLQAQTADAAA